jgi:hypothetical protein
MAKGIERHFKAALTKVQLKAPIVADGEEVDLEDPQIVVTMKLAANKMNMRLLDFLNGATKQKSIDVTVESAQLELV